MGVKYVTIDGERLELRFTWKALATIEQEFGDNPNLFDASVLARFLELGIKRPEWTADRITALSPPMLPMVKAVQEAIQFAYFGNEGQTGNEAEKKSRRRADGWLRRMFGLSEQD